MLYFTHIPCIALSLSYMYVQGKLKSDVVYVSCIVDKYDIRKLCKKSLSDFHRMYVVKIALDIVFIVIH